MLPSSTKKCIHTKRQHILAVSICCGISLPSGHTSESSFARKQPNSIAVAAYRPLQRATKVLGQTTLCTYREHTVFSAPKYTSLGAPPRLLVFRVDGQCAGSGAGTPPELQASAGNKIAYEGGGTIHPITSTACLDTIRCIKISNYDQGRRQRQNAAG